MKQETTKSNGIEFFVAECMEFPSLGKKYEGIPTIEEACKTFKEIPKSKKNMGNGIGAVVLEEAQPEYGCGEYSLLEGGRVDDLSYYCKDARENKELQKAVEYLNQHSKDLLCDSADRSSGNKKKKQKQIDYER